MYHISNEHIDSIASCYDWVETMEKSFLMEEGKDYIMPKRMHLDFRENTLLLMPCIGTRYYATKLVSLFPGNAGKGLPPLNGIIVLSDGDTGETLATLDGASVTAMRTAAVGSVGIRHLAPSGVTNLGVIGLGVQGINQAIFACNERNFRNIYIYDRSPERSAVFVERVKEKLPEVNIISCGNTEDLCLKSEVIITATTSTSPVLPDRNDLLEGKTIIGIGSYKPGMREFPDSLFTGAGKVFIDTCHGMTESGDLLYPVSSDLLSKDNFIELGRVISGEVKPGKTRVFKSVGMALFDLAGAIMIYEKGINRDK